MSNFARGLLDSPTFMTGAGLLSGMSPGSAMGLGRQAGGQRDYHNKQTQKKGLLDAGQTWLDSKNIDPQAKAILSADPGLMRSVMASSIGRQFAPPPKMNPHQAAQVKLGQDRLAFDREKVGRVGGGRNRGFKTFKDRIKTEQDLRKEHTSLSSGYQKVRDSWGRIQSSIGRGLGGKVDYRKGTGASDIALIFNYMKMLDPSSVVREGEFATAQNSGGVGAKVRTMYNAIMDGQKLTPELRRNFYNQSGVLFKRSDQQYQKQTKRFGAIARGYGLDPSEFLMDHSPAQGVKSRLEHKYSAGGPPTNSPQGGAGNASQQPNATMPPQAIPTHSERQIGTIYNTPRGQAVWRGNGWERVQ